MQTKLTADFEQKPEDATLFFRAGGVAEGPCNRTITTVSDWGLRGEEMDDREYTLNFSLPRGLEEPMAFTNSTDRYEAIESAFAGLPACINGTIQFYTLREGIPLMTSRQRYASQLSSVSCSASVTSTSRTSTWFLRASIRATLLSTASRKSVSCWSALASPLRV